MKRLLWLGLLCGLIRVSAVEPFPSEPEDWHGFERYSFSVKERAAWVVVPEVAAEGRPWIWRARFFGHEPQADIALLKEGYHVAYCDVANLYGNPAAVAIWSAFYERVTQRHGLAARPALEGMSRGGLIIYNWAAANPDKVACIYGDAPVCDIKSWPGGLGEGPGSKGDWQRCLAAYGLDEKSVESFRGNPIDHLAPLAVAGVPVLHVVGDADKPVPLAENSAVLEARYRALGGSIQVIVKEGVGHHPHSLEDPGPIVSFVRRHTQPNVRLRGHLNHSWIRFERERRGHVAFIGGSITEMNGYRPMVARDLQQRFPETAFQFTNAGVASTCSTTGAFRLSNDVLGAAQVDLLFIEFAVNDDQDAGHAFDACVRGMEGLIRQARRANPRVDIVVTYFLNERMLSQLQAGQTPVPIRAHEAVASHYGVSTIHLAKEVAERIQGEALTWERYGGVHPKPYGNRIAADLIQSLLKEAWGVALPPGAQDESPMELPAPLDPWHYGQGRFVPLEQAELGAGWEIREPDWDGLPGSKRARFLNRPLLCASEAGAEMRFEFRGTTVGAYLLAGPDAGALEVQVDQGPVHTVELYHRYSRGLHYPRTVLFGTELEPGTHTVRVRLAEPTERGGHAARVLTFVAN